MSTPTAEDVRKYRTLYQELGWTDGGEGWRRVGPVYVIHWPSRDTWQAECDRCHAAARGGTPAQAVHYLAQTCDYLKARALGVQGADPAAALAEAGADRRAEGQRILDQQQAG